MEPTDSILASCQEALSYQFNDLELLRQALLHASAANCRIQSNERLEFLGDSILGMVICQELYERFPDYLEGELTKIKSHIVSRRTCARVARKLSLEKFLCVGKGMSAHNKLPNSCVSAAFEAVIGAIYMDSGLERARQFILDNLSEQIDSADASEHQDNYKSMLQQYIQKHFDSTPCYELLDEKGPDHSKCFEIGVAVNQRRFVSAWGPSKKEAEQLAAYNALTELGVLNPNSEFSSTIQ